MLVAVEVPFHAEGEADVVEAVEQAVFAEGIDVEVGVEAVRVGDGLVGEVDGDLVLRVGGGSGEKGLGFLFGEAGEDDTVLAGVGEEDIGEAGRDDGAEAVLVEGPGGVLAGGAAAEVALCDEDLGAVVVRFVEDEVGVRFAGVGTFLDAAPVEEEEFAVAGALDAFEELLGDDLVGVDVGKGRGAAVEVRMLMGVMGC